MPVACVSNLYGPQSYTFVELIPYPAPCNRVYEFGEGAGSGALAYVYRATKAEPRRMDRPYDSIPRTGRHGGEQRDEEPSSSVRAPDAPHPPAREPERPAPAYHLYHNEAEGIYRIHSWQAEAPGAPEGEADYRPVGRYDAVDALIEQLSDQARYVVFENSETGDVYYSSEQNLTSWATDDRFDRVTVFNDNEAAAAYVEARQRGQ